MKIAGMMPWVIILQVIYLGMITTNVIPIEQGGEWSWWIAVRITQKFLPILLLQRAAASEGRSLHSKESPQNLKQRYCELVAMEFHREFHGGHIVGPCQPSRGIFLCSWLDLLPHGSSIFHCCVFAFFEPKFRPK